MKKIVLDLDTLAVESFEAGEAESLRGTVGGHIKNTLGCPETVDGCPSPLCAPTSWETCHTCEGYDSCVPSCYGQYTCPGACA